MVHKQPLSESDFAKDKRYITNDVMKDMKNTQTMMNAKTRITVCFSTAVLW